MNLRAIRSMGLGIMLCLSWCVIAAPAMAAPASGKITGVVVDSTGTPQMGATVMISSDQLLNSMVFQLLTNEHGRFSSATLPAGNYSVKVTLAGFLPAVEQDIQVRDEQCCRAHQRRGGRPNHCLPAHGACPFIDPEIHR